MKTHPVPVPEGDDPACIDVLKFLLHEFLAEEVEAGNIELFDNGHRIKRKGR